jgi:hypothetical protein
MIPQIATMPRWMSRILADAHPTKAFEVVMATATVREEPFVQMMKEAEMTRMLETRPTDDLISTGEWPRAALEGGYSEAFSSTMEAYSRWLHSGSPAIQLDKNARRSLDQLVTPRFHALTRMEGEGRTYLVEDMDERGNAMDILVQATPEGPKVSVFTQSVHQTESNYHKLFSGHWDILRWHGREWEKYSMHGAGRKQSIEFQDYIAGYVRMALNAVAAIEESREILRRAPVSKKSKRKRGKDRGRSKAPKPLVYWLEQNALDAWVEKTVAVTRSSSEGSSTPGERTGTRRLHNCREHYRRTWVLRPREGEAVIEVGEGRVRKDGSRATLYRVMRLVEAHARGTDVAPQALQVKGVSP